AGVTTALDAERPTVGDTDEAVPHVHPGVQTDDPRVDRRKDTHQGGHLDRARGVVPGLRVVAEIPFTRPIVEGDRDRGGAGVGTDPLQFFGQVFVSAGTHPRYAVAAMVSKKLRRHLPEMRQRWTEQIVKQSGWGFRSLPVGAPEPSVVGGRNALWMDGYRGTLIAHLLAQADQET